jgi:hypothetical protein
MRSKLENNYRSDRRKKMKNRLPFTALFLVVVLSNNIYSQWSTDPAVNNVICKLASHQENPTIASDGFGGAIITWMDQRNGNDDIYAQRINANGDTLWATADGGGVVVCTEGSQQEDPTITSDGSGGAIIAWVDLRHNATTNYDIYAQRINSSGITQWAADGLPICTQTSSSYNPAILGDGSGGAIITWWDLRNGNSDIYAQRINSSGTPQWITFDYNNDPTTDGVAICTVAGTQRYPAITSDGSTGAIITWYDERSGSSNPDIYAQQINTSGAPQWTADGVAVCTNSYWQWDPSITSDGSGGAIITWWDNRNGNYDIFAQKINTSGTLQWPTGTPTTEGIGVCTLPLDQEYPSITSDGSGGAIIAWVDSRNYNTGMYTLSDIYAQRINASGAAQWGADVEICTNPASQYRPYIVSAGSGGAIVTWNDYRANNYDVYASKVSSDGALPVELTSFTSTKGNDGTILLKWITATEVNNYGFEIEKTVISNQQAVTSWKKIDFVEGAGTTNVPKKYSYSDKNLSAGKYSYRLKQIDRDGKFEYSQSVEVTVEQRPNVFALEQNYPNPFNPSTVISYQLPLSGQVSLKVYDAVGREVATLVNEVKEAGSYTAHFDGTKLSSGIYFARLVSAGKTQMRKLLLMK